MVASGYKQSLYWGCESTYGSAHTIDEPIGLVQSVNPSESNNLIKIKTLGGTRDYSNIVPGTFEITGSFDYYLQGCAFLRQAFGEDTATTTTVDSGPKIHTGASYLHVLGSAESPTTDSFPSFTLEFTDAEDTGADADTANLKRTYAGCRVNTLGISGSVDEPLRISVDWIGQGVEVSTAAASSVSESTDDPYVFYQGAVYATSGGITAYTVPDSGSMIAEVNSFDFSVNNNLESVWYISGTTNAHQTLRGLKNLIVKGRDYESSLGLHFKNRQMYQRFLGSNSATEPQNTLGKYQIALDFVKTGTIGADPKVATDNWIRIVLGSCAFNSVNITGAPEDVVSQDIDIAVEKAKCYIVDDDSDYS